MSKIRIENDSKGQGSTLSRRQLKTILKLSKHQDIRVLDHPPAKIVEAYQGDWYAEHTRYHIEADGTIGLVETDINNTGDWTPKEESSEHSS